MNGFTSIESWTPDLNEETKLEISSTILNEAKFSASPLSSTLSSLYFVNLSIKPLLSSSSISFFVVSLVLDFVIEIGFISLFNVILEIMLQLFDTSFHELYNVDSCLVL